MDENDFLMGWTSHLTEEFAGTATAMKHLTPNCVIPVSVFPVNAITAQNKLSFTRDVRYQNLTVLHALVRGVKESGKMAIWYEAKKAESKTLVNNLGNVVGRLLPDIVILDVCEAYNEAVAEYLVDAKLHCHKNYQQELRVFLSPSKCLIAEHSGNLTQVRKQIWKNWRALEPAGFVVNTALCNKKTINPELFNGNIGPSSVIEAYEDGVDFSNAKIIGQIQEADPLEKNPEVVRRMMMEYVKKTAIGHLEAFHRKAVA